MRKLISLIILAFTATLATAQVLTSNTATVALSLNVPSSITVSATPNTITFDLNGNANTAITVTTSWNLSAMLQIDEDAYFTTPTAALIAPGGAKIPSSGVFAGINGAAGVACNVTDTVGVGAATAGGTCTPRLVVVNTTGVGTGSAPTSTIALSIPHPEQYTPGNYTGILTISAQAN